MCLFVMLGFDVPRTCRLARWWVVFVGFLGPTACTVLIVVELVLVGDWY